MDLVTIVVNLATAIADFQSLAGALAFGIGLYFTYFAVSRAIKASAMSSGQDKGGAGIVTALVIGGLLMDFSTTMSGAFSSMSGQDGRSYGMVAYSGATALGKFAPAVSAAMTILSTFGWWYALKGWVMLKKASEGGGNGYQDYAWKGFIHILGGAAMINIATTLDAFKETTGLAF